MDASRIYWPRVWGETLGKSMATLVGLAGASVVLLVLGTWALLAGAFDAAALPLGLVLPTLSGLAVAYLAGRRGLRRGWNGARSVELLGRPQSAVLISYGRVQKYVYVAASLVMALFFASLPLILTQTRMSSSRVPPQVIPILSALALVSGLYFASVLISRAVRKRGLLGVGLSRDGVYHWSWFGCCFFAWDWIHQVHAGEYRRAICVVLDVLEPRPRAWDPEENLLARLGPFRRDKVRIPVGFLKPNPAVSLYAIEFYRRHPELRHELGSDKGVERIRKGDLPDVILEVYNNGRFLPAASTTE